MLSLWLSFLIRLYSLFAGSYHAVSWLRTICILSTAKFVSSILDHFPKFWIHISNYLLKYLHLESIRRHESICPKLNSWLPQTLFTSSFFIPFEDTCTFLVTQAKMFGTFFDSSSHSSVSNLLGNTVGFTSKIYPESDFSPPFTPEPQENYPVRT